MLLQQPTNFWLHFWIIIVFHIWNTGPHKVQPLSNIYVRKYLHYNFNGNYLTITSRFVASRNKHKNIFRPMWRKIQHEPLERRTLATGVKIRGQDKSLHKALDWRRLKSEIQKILLYQRNKIYGWLTSGEHFWSKTRIKKEKDLFCVVLLYNLFPTIIFFT